MLRLPLRGSESYSGSQGNRVEHLLVDWPDQTVGLGPNWTGLILVQSGPKVKDRTVKQSIFLVWTGLKPL
jgi:hypothetical protein